MKRTAKIWEGDGTWDGLNTKEVEVEAEYTIYTLAKVAILNDCLPRKQMQMLECQLMLLEDNDEKEPQGAVAVPDGYFLIDDHFTLNEFMRNKAA